MKASVANNNSLDKAGLPCLRWKTLHSDASLYHMDMLTEYVTDCASAKVIHMDYLWQLIMLLHVGKSNKLIGSQSRFPPQYVFVYKIHGHNRRY